MNDIIQSSEFDGQPVSGPPHASGQNPIMMAHHHLRGRYPFALGLGLLLAIPLAVIGYLVMPPYYTSTGIVRVAPTIPKVIYKTDESTVPPFFESFVGTQASILGSRRVLDMALDDPDLKKTAWPKGPEGTILLGKTLEISNRRAAEIIQATVRYKDPVLAQAALNAVLRSYIKIDSDLNSGTVTDRETKLRQRETELGHQLDTLRLQLQNLSSLYATDDVEEPHSAKIAELTKYSAIVQSLELSLLARSRGKTVNEPLPEDQVVSEQILAQEDPTLAKLLDQKVVIQTEMDGMSRKLAPDHRQLREIRQRFDAITASIAAQVAKDRAIPRENDPTRMAVNGTMSVDQINELRDHYVKLRDAALADANKLEETKLKIAGIKDGMSEVKKNLDDTRKTLDEIRVESKDIKVGRVSIEQWGDIPYEPSTDRRFALAAVGGLGGLGLGLATFLLLGIMRGGYRYIDELERTETAVPLLGTVPDLSITSPEHEAMAALSIHHLRNMLQLQGDKGAKGGKVYSITSSAAGDGKTSLSIALAMSFAASGRRTIIVDTDLVGRGLTRQLEMSTLPGLCEAMRADKLNGEVHATKVASLWAVPAGLLQGFVPEHMSSGIMGRIIQQLRGQFDAVILDTGPILGSLEANVVAPASDGVVLVVSRGQNTKAVRASIQRLRRLGAVCSGIIFNRATAKDFDRSISTASVSARSVRATSAVAKRGDGGAARAMLLRAVAAQASGATPNAENDPSGPPSEQP